MVSIFKMNKTQLLCLVIGLIISAIILNIGYGFSLHKSAIAVNSSELTSLYGKWFQSGRSNNITTSNILYSKSSNINYDTNKYIYHNTVVNGLFSCMSDRFVKRGYIFISDEGQLFWVDKSKRLTRIKTKI
jgi:hypothetical protein